jgi:hypothetical protein
MAGGIKWVGTRVDLILVPPELRALLRYMDTVQVKKNLCMTLLLHGLK